MICHVSIHLIHLRYVVHSENSRGVPNDLLRSDIYAKNRTIVLPMGGLNRERNLKIEGLKWQGQL